MISSFAHKKPPLSPHDASFYKNKNLAKKASFVQNKSHSKLPIVTKKGLPNLVFTKESGVPTQLVWEGELTPRLDDEKNNPCKIIVSISKSMSFAFYSYYQSSTSLTTIGSARLQER